MNPYLAKKIENAPSNKKYFSYEEVVWMLKRDYPEVWRDILERI